jgi:Putative zinc-finger
VTHPEDLLSDYVDGTLGEDQRAVVDAHLQGCATCREEVSLAREAVTVLASLEEVPVPFGVTGPVLADAGRRFERRRRVAWERLQWSAGLAAAAALVLVVVLNLGGDEQQLPTADGSASTGATAAGGAESAADRERFAAGFDGLERQEGVNYDESGIRAVAHDSAVALTDQGAAPNAGTPAPGAETATEATLMFGVPGRAITCLERSGAPVADERDTLLRLIEAEFDGTPAYIAAFLESPGADQPPDKILIWVAAVDGCRFLSGATQPI